jgi:hypothetical protein
VLKICHALDVRIQASHMFQTRLTGVTHCLQIAIRQPFEVTNEIGSPISAPNNTHHNWFFHITASQSVGDSYRYYACPIDSFGGHDVCHIGLTTSYRLWADFPPLSETPFWLAPLPCSKTTKPKASSTFRKMHCRLLIAAN